MLDSKRVRLNDQNKQTKSRFEGQMLMIRVSFSQASELCSKIHKWQEVRYLKFQHGLPHI